MIAACLKWVDRRPEIDPLTGAVQTDARTSGPSEADEAALEWALRIGEAWGDEVVVIGAGPSSIEPMLRDAVAAGAYRAVRVDLDGDAPSDRVGAAIAASLGDDAAVVMCGAWSLDRGTGSVPAFIAAELDAAQALGAVTLSIEAGPDRAIGAERRLDRGRRERVRVTAPAVLSVEAASARLRRAPLAGVLTGRTVSIDVHVAPPSTGRTSRAAVRTMPFRPRARVLAAPPSELSVRERVLALSGALVDREPPRVVRLEAAAAATELLDQLRSWGYR
jgi:electron transfer flavoprotein beta subunit